MNEALEVIEHNDDLQIDNPPTVFSHGCVTTITYQVGKERLTCFKDFNDFNDFND